MAWTYHIYSPLDKKQARRLVDSHAIQVQHFAATHPEMVRNAERWGECYVADYYLFDRVKGLYLKEAPGYPRVYLSELVESSMAPNHFDEKTFEALKACRTAIAIEKPVTLGDGKVQVAQIVSLLERVGENAFFDAGQFHLETAKFAHRHWGSRPHYDELVHPLTLRPLKPTPPKEMSAVERISVMIESAQENPETSLEVREWLHQLDSSEQQFIQAVLETGDAGTSGKAKPMAEKLLQELTALVVNE